MPGVGGVHDGLSAALAANTAGSGVPHVVVALPSYSVGESLLAHYGDRLMALEHRYLVSLLLPHRLSDVEVVFVGSIAPSPGVVAYYRSLGPDPAGFDARTHVVSLDDRTPRCVAEKLLDRPDVLERIRAIVGERPGVVEPWNVTEHEVRVAHVLGLPVNGMHPDLRPLGFKSAGRRLFRDAGVSLPRGVEDLRSAEEVVDAAAAVQALPDPPAAVVVKHDDSGAGDGNAVLRLVDESGTTVDRAGIRSELAAQPAWYLDELRHGAVVEELLTGARVSSPSAQLDLMPDGRVEVIATHEQLLGGENGQVFLGCRFPADPAYAAALAVQADAVGKRLLEHGAVGRASVDFVTVSDEAGRWQTYSLEANLRKGGTTHPYAALRNLVPGRYDAAGGRWVADLDGGPRTYVCTDNCVDPAWRGLAPALVIDAVRAAGLDFDHRTGTGVVLHMLDGLGVDGRFGVVAIGTDPAHSDELFTRTAETVAALRPHQLPG